MRGLTAAAMAVLMLPGGVLASEAGDRLVAHLYAGTAGEGLGEASEACSRLDQEGCFAEGLIKLVLAYDGLAEDLYRYGAVTPDNPAPALLFGMDIPDRAVPANPNPEPLTYPALRTVLEDFLADLDLARVSFENAGEIGDYVIVIDPLQVRIDFNGDGKVDDGETLGALLASVGEFADIPAPDRPAGGKSKGGEAAGPADTTVGFDRADALWFAGYSQIAATPVDFLLAHDFSGFFDAFLHRVFPKSGLPMQDHVRNGNLFMDADSDNGIADMIAAIHTMDFPVIDSERLAGVRERLKAISGFSRQNWALILAETDDNRELVPSPSQTSILPGMTVTEKTVSAWMATLDTFDQVLDGELLVPHWRFKQGIDLKAYFETATETDLVMLIAGQGALPFLRDGPVASAESFAEANRAFGANWINYAFWFN